METKKNSSVKIDSLENAIKQANHDWATDEVVETILRYWGVPGTNREMVHEAICEEFKLRISFNQMRYFVATYMRKQMKERNDSFAK